jgi:selenium-binding protein 1
LFLGLIIALPGGLTRADDDDREHDPDRGGGEKYLYIWAGHVDHLIPDFLAVIDFDEDSPGYGRVINTVPLPGPGATFNEPHHMHLSADGNVLGCGGLLSVLSGQPGIFFFNVTDPRRPRFLFSTSDPNSSITDDFLPLPAGGFLVTQVGSANGDAPGRVVEFDGRLHRVGSWPVNPPHDGFNPHGISVRADLNLMLTSDFILPDSTLSVVPGPPVLRSTVRVWDFRKRRIVKTIEAPGGVGMLDVKLLPGDRRGLGYTSGRSTACFIRSTHKLGLPSRHSTSRTSCPPWTRRSRGACRKSSSPPATARGCSWACSKPARWSCSTRRTG